MLSNKDKYWEYNEEDLNYKLHFTRFYEDEIIATIFNDCGAFYADFEIEDVYESDENNDIDNLMPTCRMCNFYKRTFTVDEFRKNLETLHERLRKPFIYRLALKYGLIEEHKKNVVFYFENENENG